MTTVSATRPLAIPPFLLTPQVSGCYSTATDPDGLQPPRGGPHSEFQGGPHWGHDWGQDLLVQRVQNQHLSDQHQQHLVKIKVVVGSILV